MISPRLTSPTMMRRGLWRSACAIRSCSVISPTPSEFGSRASNAMTSGCWRISCRQQLVLRLEGGDPLLGRDLAGQRPQQGGLPRVDASGDDDVAATAHGCGQERRERGVNAAQLHEPAQADVREPVAPQRHAGPRGHRHGRGHPGAAGQGDVHQRRGSREVPGRLTAAGGPVPDHRDQRLVAGRDRRPGHPLAGRVRDPDLVAPVDVDVLHLRVAQVGRERPHAVPLVVYSAGQLIELPARRRRQQAGPDLSFQPAPRRLPDDRHDLRRAGAVGQLRGDQRGDLADTLDELRIGEPARRLRPRRPCRGEGPAGGRCPAGGRGPDDGRGPEDGTAPAE